MSTFFIRPALASDAGALLDLIRRLALYEQAADQVANTAEGLLRDGFGNEPAFFAWMAEAGGLPVGFALAYYRYSTWRGKVLYLEDLFVVPPYRGKGIGKALIDTVREKAKSENLPGVSFQVLDWNEPAIGFYQRLGAAFDPAWWNGFIETGMGERDVPADRD
jgi:GNAT superfamily N-acetyltransferase